MATIRDLMTPNPHSVGPDQTLAEAFASMREHGVRHLPVVEAGVVAGLIALRDITLLSAMDEVDPKEVSVREAMVREPFSVPPSAPLETVIQHMADRKLEAALVVEDEVVLGIVTTIDCLRCLWHHLASERPDNRLWPSAVRERILNEHEQLGLLLDELDALIKQLGKPPAVDALRMLTRRLLDRLGAHLDLEDAILAPALRETPGFGKEREERLLAHHQAQRGALRETLARLESEVSPEELVEEVEILIAEIRADMDEENKTLLNPNVLRDDPINVDFGG